MRIDGREYTKAEVLQHVGNLNQVGGTRHYILADGSAKGVSAVDFDTGSGFRFTVLPDRGLDISAAGYKGTNLVYLTQNGEVAPSFFEQAGIGWLRTFFAGLLTTCGPTYLGAPCTDQGEELGIHGRFTVTPARQVADTSGWEGDDYRLEISGIIEESRLFGNKVRVKRTISSRIGTKSLFIRDTAENFGFEPSPFHILYHINAGFPLLSDGAELLVAAKKSTAYNEHSAQGMDEMLTFTGPTRGFQEQNFLHEMASGPDGWTSAAFINRRLSDGLGLFISFDTSALPYLSQWRMMGQGDYVVGIEPCNAPCDPRAVLREKGILPFLQPGEVREINLEIGVLDGNAEIDAFAEAMKAGQTTV